MSSSTKNCTKDPPSTTAALAQAIASVSPSSTTSTSKEQIEPDSALQDKIPALDATAPTSSLEPIITKSAVNATQATPDSSTANEPHAQDAAKGTDDSANAISAADKTSSAREASLTCEPSAASKACAASAASNACDASNACAASEAGVASETCAASADSEDSVASETDAAAPAITPSEVTHDLKQHQDNALSQNDCVSDTNKEGRKESLLQEESVDTLSRTKSGGYECSFDASDMRVINEDLGVIFSLPLSFNEFQQNTQDAEHYLDDKGWYQRLSPEDRGTEEPLNDQKARQLSRDSYENLKQAQECLDQGFIKVHYDKWFF